MHLHMLISIRTMPLLLPQLLLQLLKRLLYAQNVQCSVPFCFSYCSVQSLTTEQHAASGTKEKASCAVQQGVLLLTTHLVGGGVGVHGVVALFLSNMPRCDMSEDLLWNWEMTFLWHTQDHVLPHC